MPSLFGPLPRSLTANRLRRSKWRAVPHLTCGFDRVIYRGLTIHSRAMVSGARCGIKPNNDMVSDLTGSGTCSPHFIVTCESIVSDTRAIFGTEIAQVYDVNLETLVTL